MPNVFLTSETIASTGLELLRRELVLPRLVSRLGLADFRGAMDDTVNVRVPALLTARDYEWRTRTAPIVIDTITETSIPVALDSHIYSAVGLTDEELTLDITDFAVQVLNPQLLAVAEGLENLVADVIVAAPYDPALTVAYVEDADSAGAPFHRALVDARKVLNDAKVPMAGRVVVVGSAVEAAALKEEGFRRVNESGSESALRDALLGNVAGFTVVASQAVAPDFAVAFHRSAFVLGNVAPEVPAGVTFGSSQVFDGLAMRWIRDYDPNYLRDRSVVSSFAGAASVDDGPLVDIDGAGPNPAVATNRRAVLIDFTAAA